jgi:hypothetical protein
VILGAGLLLLIGLGLLVAGVVTGVTALYWACVGVCVVAAVLLFLVRRRLAVEPAAAGRAQEPTITPTTVGPSRPEAAGPAGATEPSVAKEQATARRTTAAPEPVDEPVPVAAREPEPEPEPEPASVPGPGDLDEAPLEEVEVTDLLLILDLHDEVLVIDEHPRYHLSGCVHLTGRTTIPLPIDEARTDGFTPCGACRPDRHLADAVRARTRTPEN